MITYFFRTIKDSELKTLDAARAGVWAHAVAPTDEEMANLVASFGLEEAILNDAKDLFEVPRLEREGEISYFFTRYPFDVQEEDIDSAPLLIVTGPTFVLTVSPKKPPFLQPFIDGREVVHTTQKAKLFIEIMSALTKDFERKLVRLRRAVKRDRSHLRDIGKREIVRLVNYENELNDMVDSLSPTNIWLRQVTAANHLQLYKNDVELMEDLIIANSQLVDSARSVLKTIQNVRNASEAILTSNLNVTIRTLTILTILLTIPMIITSFYGMNVPLPFASDVRAFGLILIFIFVLMGLLVLFFKRNRWL